MQRKISSEQMRNHDRERMAARMTPATPYQTENNARSAPRRSSGWRRYSASGRQFMSAARRSRKTAFCWRTATSTEQFTVGGCGVAWKRDPRCYRLRSMPACPVPAAGAPISPAVAREPVRVTVQARSEAWHRQLATTATGRHQHGR